MIWRCPSSQPRDKIPTGTQHKCSLATRQPYCLESKCRRDMSTQHQKYHPAVIVFIFCFALRVSVVHPTRFTRDLPAHPSTILHLLALDRSYDLTRVFCGPELQEPDPLPRPHVQPAVRNRDRDARADQRGFDMCLSE